MPPTLVAIGLLTKPGVCAKAMTKLSSAPSFRCPK